MRARAHVRSGCVAVGRCAVVGAAGGIGLGLTACSQQPAIQTGATHGTADQPLHSSTPDPATPATSPDLTRAREGRPGRSPTKMVWAPRPEAVRGSEQMMATYRNFLQTVIGLEGAPSRSAAGLQQVATGAALTRVETTLRTLRADHQRMAGPVIFRPLVLQFSPRSDRA